MDIVFNELSLHNLPSNDNIAKEAMDKILQCLIDVKKRYKINVSFLSKDSLTGIQICSCDYSVMKWISNLDPDSRRFFITVSSKNPFIQDYPYYIFQGSESKGFGFAHELNLITISYDHSGSWKDDTYTLKKQSLEEESLIFQEEDVLVKHIGNNIISAENHVFIEAKLKEDTEFERLGIKSGEELESMLEDLFPSLVFTQTAKDCIKAYKSADPHVKAIYGQLLELNNFFSTWDGLPKNFKDMFSSKTSPESETRLKDHQTTLTIMCPDETYRLFDWHKRFTPGAGRLYFYPDSDNGNCYIGYIGKKL